MVVADHKPQAAQSAGSEAAEEVGPERLGLDLADVQADDLAVPGFGDGVGDDEGFADDATVVSDLDVLGVEPEVGVGRLEWALTELLDVVVEP